MKRLVPMLVVLLVLGCGGGDKEGGEACESGSECASGSCFNGLCEGDGSNNDNNPNNADPFACGEAGATMCQAGQYCLVSQVDNVESAAECFTIPECGMDACECAGDDAPNNSSTCEGALQSSSCNNSDIVVTCNRSGIML